MRLGIGFILLFAVLGAQEPLPLEDLRAAGTEKVRAMRAIFDNELALALRVWAEVPATEDTPTLRKANASMASWIPGFPQALLDSLCQQANPLLRERMLGLLRDSGVRDLLGPARALLKAQQAWPRSVGITLIGALGELKDARDLVTMLARQPEPAVEEQAHILEALAALKAPESGAAARARLNHASGMVRLAALRAIATIHAVPREEIPHFARAIQDDAEVSVKAGALRALSAYGENLDALRILHEQVQSVDPLLAGAALESLEKCANKDTSRSYLLEAINGPGNSDFKERCARLLSRLGDPRGARQLCKGARDAATAAPKDPDVQIAAGDQLKRLGAWTDAVEYYKKAIDLLKTAQKYRARVPWARVLALQGRYEDAWDQLKPDYRNLAGFADDPDFAEMKRATRWAPLFNQER